MVLCHFPTIGASVASLMAVSYYFHIGSWSRGQLRKRIFEPLQIYDFPTPVCNLPGYARMIER